MNKLGISIVIGFIILFTIIGIWIVWFTGYAGGRIEQEYKETVCTRGYYTFVWKNGNIVKTWTDNMDSIVIHPEIPKQRWQQGQMLLKSLK